MTDYWDHMTHSELVKTFREDVRKYLKSPRDSEDVFHFACVVHDALTCGLSHDTIENAIYEEFCKNTAQHARDR